MTARKPYVLPPVPRPIILGTVAEPVAYPPPDLMTDQVWDAMTEEEQKRYRVRVTVDGWAGSG